MIMTAHKKLVETCQEKLATANEAERVSFLMVALAEEIRTWAPPENQAKIWNRAVHDIADRIQREAGLTDGES